MMKQNRELFLCVAVVLLFFVIIALLTPFAHAEGRSRLTEDLLTGDLLAAPTGVVPGTWEPQNATDIFDMYIDATAATTNYGSAKLLALQDLGGANYQFVMVGLTNIADSIGAGKTITQAKLHIYYVPGAVGSVTKTYTILRNATEAGATWNNYKTSTAWSTAGALESGTDYNATASDSRDMISDGAGYKTFLIDTAAANAAYNGDDSLVVILRAELGSIIQEYFISTDTSNASLWPYFEIDYE